MKKLLVCLLALVLVFSFAACGKDSGNDDSTDPAAEGMDVMFVVTGSLGGGTNNDDVYGAITDYLAIVGGECDTFECNMDTSLYESTLMQAAETGQYDLIVTGFDTMVEPLANTAAAFPDQKFLIFDTTMPFDGGANSNVISVRVYQNEGAFLAGALAALITTSDAELANEDKVLGFVGAIESPAILDFLVGYIDGVNYVDSSIEVLYSFVGNHTDSALAKELALTQYQQGADVVFACGQNGLGVAEAALDANGYVIGVDYDYATRLAETSPETAAHVLTSVQKDYYGMVYPILKEIYEGTAQWGSHKNVSYGEGGVIVSDNEYTKAIVPDAVRTEYEAVVSALSSGTVSVSTALGKTTEEIEEMKALAAPF